MTAFSTELSRRIGLTYPIVAAPMFLISNKEMIVAAAEAGILGTMPSLNARTPEQLEEDLRWIRDKTDRPFGINLTIGLTPEERIEADVALCEKYEVPVLITSYGDPTALTQRWHARGGIVMHDVINLRHAKKAEAAGVDAIIAVAAGAGGHAGKITPFTLYPWLAGELSVPVVGAGAISTGQQIAAALSLGAQLAYMGTRFIASAECGAQDAYKQKVVDATPEDIVYTNQVSGIHANFIKSTVPEMDATRPKDGSAAKRWKDIWSAGHGVGLIHEVKPLGTIVDDLVQEFHDTVGRLASLSSSK